MTTKTPGQIAYEADVLKRPYNPNMAYPRRKWQRLNEMERGCWEATGQSKARHADQNATNDVKFTNCFAGDENTPGYDAWRARVMSATKIVVTGRSPNPLPDALELSLAQRTIADLRASNAELLVALKKLTNDVQELMGASDGVAGLHRNGDLADWSSLDSGGHFEEWLGDGMHTARTLIAKIEGSGP